MDNEKEIIPLINQLFNAKDAAAHQIELRERYVKQNKKL